MMFLNLLESVNEYCKERNDEFVLSKPGEMIELCGNGFVVLNDEECMIFTNPKTVSNFTIYSTSTSTKSNSTSYSMCHASCIYNENNRKFISMSIFDVIADLVRALNSMEILAYNYDDGNSEFYEDVAHMIEHDFNSYMDSALINILDFAEIDIDMSYFKFSDEDEDDIYNHFKKDFKTLCKLFMVVNINVEDAFDYTVRVYRYWAKGNEAFMEFMYNFRDALYMEVIPELEQEFNITQ